MVRRSDPGIGEVTGDRRRGPVLLADIGGTNARFRIAGDGTTVDLPTIAVRDHPTVESAIAAVLAGHAGGAPAAAVLAVAGPIADGRMHLTNAAWEIDAAQVGERCGFARVRLVNDFAALAWSLPALTDRDLVALGGGAGDARAPRVVLGPGTGLGAAAYVEADRGIAIEGEGGHVSLAAADDRESAVVAQLRRRFGHVSVERAVSGQGLVNLYEAIATIDGVTVAARTPDEITTDASAGGCDVCRAALDMFCAFLGAFAGDLALTFGARGGIYVAGGIAPRIRTRLAASRFHDRLVDKGRFRQWLEAIPVRLVVHPAPALVGLERLIAMTDVSREHDG
ncbi:MAG: glucokinase [Alphaproteobacteria bacterium]|nr:glucokinase [Alphaproteobacteria bacterium]